MKRREWGKYYDEKLDVYSRLAAIVAVLLRQQLQTADIKFLSVSERVKNRASFLEKIDRKGYSNPAKQLTDFTGIRIVTYLPSQVDQICTMMEEVFDVDQNYSGDKSDELGTDRVGYQSKHFVCRLGKRRSRLPEYHGVHNLPFEVQVRTILQHAWADLAHGKSYKFSSRLPKDLQRRLNLHAGNLELVDIGLDELSTAIDSYSASISTNLARLRLESVNAISLRDYISEAFPTIEHRPNIIDNLVDEISDFGLKTIGEFDDLISNDFRERLKENSKTSGGIVRITLMVADIRKYFNKSWKKHHWSIARPRVIEFLKSLPRTKDIEKILREKKIEIVEDDA